MIALCGCPSAGSDGGMLNTAIFVGIGPTVVRVVLSLCRFVATAVIVVDPDWYVEINWAVVCAVFCSIVILGWTVPTLVVDDESMTSMFSGVFAIFPSEFSSCMAICWYVKPSAGIFGGAV